MGRPDYPPARRLDLVEALDGQTVADPYRWLEDPGSEETRAWAAAQDVLFAASATTWPARDRFRARLAELVRTGTVGSPIWRGDRCFFLRREPDQEHAVLLTRESDGSERALVDPMTLDPTGTTTLDAWQPDKEGRLLAYQLSSGGDEESLLRVLDVAHGNVVD